jgi:hypothetical protein
MEPPSFDELKTRIGRDVDHHDGRLPDATAVAWYGYLAALIEWGLISPDAHQRLVVMLPSISDNPVEAILLGR